MSNYTLTTDLIADCMALIPSNLEKLVNQYYYTTLQNNKILIKSFGNTMVFSDPFDTRHELFLFNYITYNMQYISDFQKECKEYKKVVNDLYQANCEWEAKKNDKKAWGDINLVIKRLTNLEQHRLQPKTIWQATLFGNGTFPQTLDGLCESYKNVMEK